MLCTCELSHIEEKEEKVPQYKREELLLLLPIGFTMKPFLSLYVDQIQGRFLRLLFPPKRFENHSCLFGYNFNSSAVLPYF